LRFFTKKIKNPEAKKTKKLTPQRAFLIGLWDCIEGGKIRTTQISAIAQ
jgi:hypothetical protein